MSIVNQNNVLVTPNGAIVNGNNCTVTGDNCIINGNNCTVDGDNCIINGSNCTVNGDHCTINGANCIINGDYCGGHGFNPIINGDHWKSSGSYSPTASSGVTFYSAGLDSTFRFSDMIINSGINSRTISGNMPNLPYGFPFVGASSSSYPAPLSVPPKPAFPSPPEKKEFPLKKDPVEAKDDDPNTCNICMANQKDVLLIPCGHVMCVVCARKMWDKGQCPNCREKIHNVNQAFF